MVVKITYYSKDNARYIGPSHVDGDMCTLSLYIAHSNTDTLCVWITVINISDLGKDKVRYIGPSLWLVNGDIDMQFVINIPVFQYPSFSL